MWYWQNGYFSKKYLNEVGIYEGFDIVKKGIDWGLIRISLASTLTSILNGQIFLIRNTIQKVNILPINIYFLI